MFGNFLQSFIWDEIFGYDDAIGFVPRRIPQVNAGVDDPSIVLVDNLLLVFSTRYEVEPSTFVGQCEFEVAIVRRNGLSEPL